MSRKDPLLLLGDMLEALNKIKIYTSGLSQEDFFKDDKTMDAVIRNFEIVGEAANRIPEEIKENNLDVNWHRIRGLRNRIVHDYMGIDYAIVWNIIQNDLDIFARQIKSISEKLES